MAFIRRRGRRGHLLLACSLAACLMAGAPAANAVFTRTLSAGATSVGTYKLASPPGNAVTVTCTPNGNSGKYRLTLTVTSHGTVAKANNYVLVVKDSTGLAASPVTLNPGGSYTAPSPGSKWTYSIDAQYKVPGTSNAWSSDPNPVSVC
ncbi:hypothetical protein [Pseudarthrobacter oxydans]|uniref:hypothetical protein n=1 Tax=Pseudarthrobacter oxydans TaxID=1671 RepID=UPI0035E4B50C|nr:hypothetical protein GCM10017547_20090 [Pseudarthrobacter oxydans]